MTRLTRKTRMMKSSIWLARAAFFPLLFVVSCYGVEIDHTQDSDGRPGAESDSRGPNGGRLLRSGSFELEIGIFERGVPPEYRAWAKLDGQPLDPSQIDLQLELTRLGGRVERIAFDPRDDYLVSRGPIAEPHSFEVSIEARQGEARHAWSFESYEGRTRIDPAMADSLGVATELAGGAALVEVVTVYGRVRANPERVRKLRARFEGVLHRVHARVGDRVKKGDPLLTIESNESLNRYTIKAPIAGVVTQRDANAGEQTDGRLLMTLTDTSSVWVDLAVFPVDRSRVVPDLPVSITPALGGQPVEGVIAMIETDADPHDQSVIARVELEGAGPQLLPGTFVTAEVKAGEYRVPLAVRRTAVQSFREHQVVYALVGAVYEVRMLELGRAAGDWVEVLDGLAPGDRYVTRNSHLIKADIEKLGASHDH